MGDNPDKAMIDWYKPCRVGKFYRGFLNILKLDNMLNLADVTKNHGANFGMNKHFAKTTNINAIMPAPVATSAHSFASMGLPNHADFSMTNGQTRNQGIGANSFVSNDKPVSDQARGAAHGWGGARKGG
ncbi:uncharacterized protein PpBr36_11071 [Pyricularia pennisetigena]|uniref:uncharacterized protein n=1 Tax=Pyricularia pennisetigena TaxID=1578925 RepID=UPI00114EB391|nr:uncharacterized protein PpBr36_11071 [Pyricularia pennisetigena]TLS20614.1 hypothetical protein PpBr36_11071 [Pyricularia pennisetigena]